MSALPILLLGGAAIMMMGGGKKKNVVESGLLESGEKWRIKHVGQWSDGAGVGMERYYVDVKLNGKWATLKYQDPVDRDTILDMSFSSIEEAKKKIERLDGAELKRLIWLDQEKVGM